jgi:hypothetical protein
VRPGLKDLAKVGAERPDVNTLGAAHGKAQQWVIESP